MQHMKDTQIWKTLADLYKKNPIGYRFMKRQHENKGWGRVKRRLETVLMLPFLPVYGYLARLEIKRIHRGGSIFYIRDRKIVFYLPNLDLHNGDFIQNLIYLEGDYFDIDQLKKVGKYIKAHDVVLDIGANIGNHTVFFAKECHADKIYSFEPTEMTYSILERNIELNHLEKIVDAENIALGDQETKADVICVDERNCGGNQVNKSADGKIVMKTLDRLSIPEKIDFMKIDVEGFEYEVLVGGRATIEKNKPLIYVEIFEQNYDRVNGLLESMGYHCEQRWRKDYLYHFQEQPKT